MAEREQPWQRRAMTVIVVVEWIAIAIGIIGAIIDEQFEGVAYVASGFGAIWVLANTSIPHPLLGRNLVLDTFTLGGVVLTMTALALTGGADSPFFLLSLTPSILAALLGGFRPGLSAAILSTALLVAVTLAREDSIGFALVISMLYPVLAATVAHIRRILVDLENRATTAEASSESTIHRLTELEHANSLLADLADITGGTDLNPITIGRAGLQALCRRYPDSSAVAIINGETGPIIVAKHGSHSGQHEHSLKLAIGDREVGVVRLTTAEPLTAAELEALSGSLRPLALAFANALLLQDIARNAVKEERTRLARELHDEIGPSLASLGLSLDVAMINSADRRELGDHLEQLRNRVTSLVEEVRSTVSDLRSPGLGTLGSFVTTLVQDPAITVPVDVSIDERRPVRPSLAQDIYRIIGEAVRNAAQHAGASAIAVRGWADFDRGRIVVEDNGSGFDVSDLPEGHFGVMGMRERARQLGIRLNIASGSSGTRVEVGWGGE